MSSVGSVNGSGKVPICNYNSSNGKVDVYVKGDTLRVDVIDRVELHSLAGMDLVRLFDSTARGCIGNAERANIMINMDRVDAVLGANADRKPADEYDNSKGKLVDVVA